MTLSDWIFCWWRNCRPGCCFDSHWMCSLIWVDDFSGSELSQDDHRWSFGVSKGKKGLQKRKNIEAIACFLRKNHCGRGKDPDSLVSIQRIQLFFSCCKGGYFIWEKPHNSAGSPSGWTFTKRSHPIEDMAWYGKGCQVDMIRKLLLVIIGFSLEWL